MRHGLYGLVSTVALASTVALLGCSSSGSTPATGGTTTATGGSSSSGGSSSGGSANTGGTRTGGVTTNTGGTRTGGSAPATGGSSQPVKCENGTSCGGDLVGTWTVASSCLNVTGDMDMELSSLGCKTVPVTGTMTVTGTWTANSTGMYTDNTVTESSITFTIPDSCLSISSVPVECNGVPSVIQAIGWKTATCAKNSSGVCACTASTKQEGGIGNITPWAEKAGAYSASNGTMNVDDNVEYSYCVSGSQLTLTPNRKLVPTVGTIVLTKPGTPGTGGTVSTGGRVTTGGTTVTGGTAAGGSTPTGGAARTGGTATTGGTSTTGGAAVTGGSASGGTVVGTGGAVTGGTVAAGNKPCDIFKAANNTCVAAHSTVRALFSAYAGPMYQLRRASDKTNKDISAVAAGGVADTAAHEAFCAGTTCTYRIIYDQTGNGNNIGCQSGDTAECPETGKDKPANAMQESLTIGGKKVYSLYTKAGQAYWKDGSKNKMPLGSSPQGIYGVFSGTHVNSGCCYDYGNSAPSRVISGSGSMDALYFGTSTTWNHGVGTGPWVMADLENGIHADGDAAKINNNLLSLPHKYVTAVEKNNGTTEFSLRGADATVSGTLATFYKGKLPGGYSPMKKEGAIVLGSGGDCCYSNSNASEGTFYEGAIVAGYPTDATDDAVHANVVSAGYGK